MWASSREFGPGVASGSGLASARAQGGWSRCRSRALGSCRRTPMEAGWKCWGCCSTELVNCGMALMTPGWHCWGCWSPVLGSHGMPGWQCWGRQAPSWCWRRLEGEAGRSRARPIRCRAGEARAVPPALREQRRSAKPTLGTRCQAFPGSRPQPRGTGGSASYQWPGQHSCRTPR